MMGNVEYRVEKTKRLTLLEWKMGFIGIFQKVQQIF